MGVLGLGEGVSLVDWGAVVVRRENARKRGRVVLVVRSW